MNLRELLQTYKVEIPILQRDYAQGRKSQTTIANRFLSVIFKALKESKELHIDFIYGYEENGKFILIDGQQRISTLWLLHFYLYKRVNKLDEIRDLLKNFSYSVRKNSKNFCKNLLVKDFDMDKNPSASIINMGGEFESPSNLQNDPTIKAMLNMLDLIDDELYPNANVAKLAKNLDKITFELFNMENFNLGEELYIKMNARGRQLSDYENLKAFIEKDETIKQEQKLLVSIDNRWSDYFYNPESIENFDNRGKNFLHCATLFFKLESSEKLENLKDNLDFEKQSIDDFYEPLQDIKNLKWLNEIIELCLNFDEFLRIDEDLRISDAKFFDKTLGYIEVCYFFAILWFMKDKDYKQIDKNALNDYLRVSRHFIENYKLDQDKYVEPFFNLFKHLSLGSENIYDFLVKNPKHSFHSKIYALETRKAKLILESRKNSNQWEEILNQTSKHPILVGWVDFLLDFSDEEFNAEDYRYCEEDEVDFMQYQNPNLDIFTKYATLTMQILDMITIDKDNSYEQAKQNLCLFQRAFLSIGNFAILATNYFYGNYPQKIFRDRQAWNWLLSTRNYDDYPYFKDFLDELLKSKAKDLKDKMRKIIDNVDLKEKRWWEQLLIKQKGLFEFLDEKRETFQRFRRIRFFDNKVELLPNVQGQKNVRDLLDYGFYCFLKERDLNVSEYICDEWQYGCDYKLKSHFNLNNKKVLCNSMKYKIKFGNDTFEIDLENSNIFKEFDRILKEADIL